MFDFCKCCKNSASVSEDENTYPPEKEIYSKQTQKYPPTNNKSTKLATLHSLEGVNTNTSNYYQRSGGTLSNNGSSGLINLNLVNPVFGENQNQIIKNNNISQESSNHNQNNNNQKIFVNNDESNINNNNNDNIETNAAASNTIHNHHNCDDVIQNHQQVYNNQAFLSIDDERIKTLTEEFIEEFDDIASEISIPVGKQARTTSHTYELPTLIQEPAKQQNNSEINQKPLLNKQSENRPQNQTQTIETVTMAIEPDTISTNNRLISTSPPPFKINNDFSEELILDTMNMDNVNIQIVEGESISGQSINNSVNDIAMDSYGIQPNSNNEVIHESGQASGQALNKDKTMSLPVGQPFEFLKSDLHQQINAKPAKSVIFESRTSLSSNKSHKHTSSNSNSNQKSSFSIKKQILSKVNSARGKNKFGGSESNVQKVIAQVNRPAPPLPIKTPIASVKTSPHHSRTTSSTSNKSFIGALEILRTQSKVAEDFSSEFLFEMDKIIPDLVLGDKNSASHMGSKHSLNTQNQINGIEKLSLKEFVEEEQSIKSSFNDSQSQEIQSQAPSVSTSISKERLPGSLSSTVFSTLDRSTHTIPQSTAHAVLQTVKSVSIDKRQRKIHKLPLGQQKSLCGNGHITDPALTAVNQKKKLVSQRSVVTKQGVSRKHSLMSEYDQDMSSNLSPTPALSISSQYQQVAPNLINYEINRDRTSHSTLPNNFMSRSNNPSRAASEIDLINGNGHISDANSMTSTKIRKLPRHLAAGVNISEMQKTQSEVIDRSNFNSENKGLTFYGFGSFENFKSDFASKPKAVKTSVSYIGRKRSNK